MNPVEVLLGTVLFCLNGGVCTAYSTVEAPFEVTKIQMCAEGELKNDLLMENDPDVEKVMRFENRERTKAFEIHVKICKTE